VPTTGDASPEATKATLPAIRHRGDDKRNRLAAGPLLAAQVPIGSLDSEMAQQELYLLQISSGIASLPCVAPTEAMRRQVFKWLLSSRRLAMCQTILSVTPCPKSCVPGKGTETRGLRSLLLQEPGIDAYHVRTVPTPDWVKSALPTKFTMNVESPTR
jgi:hypothetical protein